VFQVVHPDRQIDTFRIGPHTPSIKPEDVHLIHRLWLNITREPGLDKLHHHDIVTEALTRFAREYAGRDRQEILKELRKTCKAAPARAGGDGNKPTTLAPARKDDDVSRKKDEGPPSPPVCGP